MSIARVETPSASSSSSSPGSRDVASDSVAPHVRTARRSRARYMAPAPTARVAASQARFTGSRGAASLAVARPC